MTPILTTSQTKNFDDTNGKEQRVDSSLICTIGFNFEFREIRTCFLLLILSVKSSCGSLRVLLKCDAGRLNLNVRCYPEMLTVQRFAGRSRDKRHRQVLCIIETAELWSILCSW